MEGAKRRGEEPAVAPAAVAQRPRGAKAAPGVPQRKECSSLERVAGTPGPYRPSRTTRRYRLRFVILAILFTAPWCAASAADTTKFDLLKDMSVADYRATGLDHLSDAQIKALSAWFANYESQHTKNCGQSAAPAPAAVPAGATSKPVTTTSKHHKVDGSIVTSSRISGKFSGWSGGTVFKLENGQTWEQTDDSVMTIAAMQNPGVNISKGAFNVYYLEVKGLLNSVPVRKVVPDDSN